MENLNCVDDEVKVLDLLESVRIRQVQVATISDLTPELGTEFGSAFVRDINYGGDFVYVSGQWVRMPLLVQSQTKLWKIVVDDDGIISALQVP